MNYGQFVEELKAQIQLQLGEEYRVETGLVTKNNSTELVGMTIRKEELSAAPTIYLEELYQRYQNGAPLFNITKEVLEIYHHAAKRVKEESYIPMDMGLESCRNRIVYRLVSKRKNEKMLKQIPYVTFLDLAVIFTVVHRQSDDGLESIRVNDSLMKRWNMTVPQLMELAAKNTERLFPAQMTDMFNIVSDYLSEEELDDMFAAANKNPLTVLTNNMRINGASVLLYKGMMQKIANKLKSDFFILPSSIHEVLILPVRNEIDKEALEQTVREVNKVAVSKEEYLSDTVYLYRREKDEFEYVLKE